MALLFKLEGKTVQPTPEVLMIYPFKDIWDRDTSVKKEKALVEFAYIEFMTSKLKTNPYREYAEDLRSKKIIDDLRSQHYIDTLDPLLREGLKYVEKFQTEGSGIYSLYMSAISAKEKLEGFLKNLDPAAKHPKTGAYMFKPKDITGALLDMSKVAASLAELQKKVDEEVYESAKIRSGKEISPFAIPD